MIGQMSRHPRMQARIWNDLVARGEIVRFSQQAELYKGSMLMADAIDRHVGRLISDLRTRMRSLPPPVHYASGLTVSETRIRQIVNDVLPQRASVDRLNGRREELIRRVVESLWPPGLRDPRMSREEAVRFRKDIRDTVVHGVSRAWEHLDFREEYVAMLSDTDRMLRVPPHYSSAAGLTV